MSLRRRVDELEAQVLLLEGELAALQPVAVESADRHEVEQPRPGVTVQLA